MPCIEPIEPPPGGAPQFNEDSPFAAAPALASAAEAAGAIALDLKHKQDDVDYAKSVADFRKGLGDIETDVSQEADPLKRVGLYEEQAKELQQSLGEDASPTVRRRIDASFPHLFVPALIDYRHRMRQETGMRQDAAVASIEPNAIDLIVKAESPLERAELFHKMYALWDSRAAGLTATKSPFEAQALKASFTARAHAALASAAMAAEDQLVNRAFADPANAPSLYKQAADTIAQAEWIPPERRAAVAGEAADRIWAGAARGAMQTDPAATIRALDDQDGIYNQFLKPATRERLIAEAGAKAKLTADDNARTISKLASDYESTVASGREWGRVAVPGLGLVDEARLGEIFKGTDREKDFLRVQRSGPLLAKFNLLPPDAQTAELDALRVHAEGNGAGGDSQARLLGLLHSAHEKTLEGLDNDALAFGAATLMLPVPPVDLAKPETLQARARLAQAIEGHYGRPVSPLSVPEAEQLTRALGQAPAEQRIALVGALAENFTPGQTQALAAQLARQGAGDLSQAIGLSAKSPETARRILQGMELKTNKDWLPAGEDAADMDRRIAGALGGLFHTRPGSFGGDSPIRNLPFIPNPDIGKIVAINLPARTGPWSYRDEDLVMELPYRPGQVYPGSASALEDAIKSHYAWASSESRDNTGRLNPIRLYNSIAAVTGYDGPTGEYVPLEEADVASPEDNGEEPQTAEEPTDVAEAASPTDGEEASQPEDQADSESNNGAPPESNRTREEGGYANDADPGYGPGDVVAAAATKSPTKANTPAKRQPPPTVAVPKFTTPIRDWRGRTISADDLNRAAAVVYAEMTGSELINKGKTFKRINKTTGTELETR